ncbi:MAG: hypothetical protein JWO36_638 [Myxococcales bacterium]|nr:hypothetical protein [Myxococcales bacterium]
MRTLSILLLLAIAGSGCNSTECATGTINRDGKCEPATSTTDPAKCGPFTVLQGDKCVPMFPPTECDPSTTTAETDPATGVTTCIGNGSSGGCSATFACPTPTATGKHTICGQIYDFQTNQPYADAMATGKKCTTATATGPCSLSVTPYDAIAFATNPSGATPLGNGGTEIDDCGRYRVKDIDMPASPFIGLGFDDASGMGPGGNTVTVGVATPANPPVTKDLEGFVVAAATTTMWASSGGPTLANGIYAPVYRAHKAMGDLFAPQAGVTFTRNAAPEPANDFYFTATQITRQTIDTAATATGANGTVLINNATIADSVAYSGTGGISDTTNCRWEQHAGASLPGLVFIQVFRTISISGLNGTL